jgi:hypothetical protein
MAVEDARVSAGNAFLAVLRNVIATVLPARFAAWTSFGAESPVSHLSTQAWAAALLAPFTVITTVEVAVPLFVLTLVPATSAVQLPSRTQVKGEGEVPAPVKLGRTSVIVEV